MQSQTYFGVAQTQFDMNFEASLVSSFNDRDYSLGGFMLP
jgi:hypothetical protein